MIHPVASTPDDAYVLAFVEGRKYDSLQLRRRRDATWHSDTLDVYATGTISISDAVDLIECGMLDCVNSGLLVELREREEGVAV